MQTKTSMMQTSLFSYAAPFALFASLLSCGSKGFDSQNKIDGVRILASKSNKPFAKPGDEVTVDLLVADGRPTKTRALQIGWFPFLCTLTT